jgi:hypothetical protein
VFRTLRNTARPEIFFVVGHPRSGTNWVSNLLNLHPRVFCDGEFHFHDAHGSVERMTADAWRGAGREPARTELRAAYADLVRRTLIAAASRKPGVTRVGDRTPRHLVPLLPGCRHIVCVRDGRDVLVSWTFHMLRHGGPWLTSGPFGRAMSTLKTQFENNPRVFELEPERLLSVESWVRHSAREWAERVRADRDMTERMRAEPTLGSARWVSYERLHADVSLECRRLFGYLGVDPGKARPPGHTPETRPGFSESDALSFFRRGRVGDWASFFTSEQERWYIDEAGDTNQIALEALLE